MKTYLVYGFAVTLAGALLNLVLYFLGYHSDAAKVDSAQMWSGIILLVIAIVCIVLGTKARRAEIPATEDFGYGRAFGAGVMITLFTALLGIVTGYLYMSIINPGFTDLLVQAKVTAMEAKGLSSSRIEEAEKMMRKLMSPVFITVFGFLGTMFWGTIISLITAAFLKRRADDALPPVTA